MANSTPPEPPLKLEEILTRLSIQQLSLGEKLDALLTHINPHHNPVSPVPSPNPIIPQPQPSSPAHSHKFKLDVPLFDGTNPNGWIFKINQFFDYHQTPPQERLTIASFYMEGRALAWFQWMQSNGQLTSWPVFLQALQLRFAQSPYDDPTGALFKLTQQGSVSTYLFEFEELANRVVGLPQAVLLTCFVAGLSPEIRREVQILQPLTLAQAAGLARIQEEKFLEQHHASRPRPSPVTTTPTLPSSSSFPRTHTAAPQPLTPNSNTLSPPFPPPLHPPPPSTKRLSPEEITSRREKGLCFTCDEKYHRGHRCSALISDNSSSSSLTIFLCTAAPSKIICAI